MEKISWTDRARKKKKDVLHRVKEERDVLHTIPRRKADCVSHILRRNCLLKHTIEGKIGGRTEMQVRRRRTRTQLLDDPKETTGYWKLKDEPLDRTLRRTRFGRLNLLKPSGFFTNTRFNIQQFYMVLALR